jgi:signal transduction histidine kinase
VLRLLGFAAFMTLFLSAGFAICSMLTDTLPPLAEYLIAVWIGFFLFFLAALIFQRIARHKLIDQHERQHHIILDALERISRGDFNVFVEADAEIHNEFAHAINDMARNLGTLETMRQDFISDVSHEIQSPLTSIGGFAELLQNPDLPTDERLRYAGIIRAESRRLSKLSDNLLKLSSLDNDPLSTAEFRLDTQLSDVILTFEPQWSAKGIVLEAELPRYTLCGDVGLLSQVWVNLLHNAIKFTPEGGRITVSLTVEDAAYGAGGEVSKGAGATNAATGNAGATIRISDTGVGISPEDQIHLFERFYKADKARDRALGGNGLGLSLVKKIVELHEGHITVESTIDQGTSFEVFLPDLPSV